MEPVEVCCGERSWPTGQSEISLVVCGRVYPQRAIVFVRIQQLKRTLR